MDGLLPGAHVGCDLAQGYYGPGSHVPSDLGRDINNPGPAPEPPEPPYQGLRASVGLAWGATRRPRVRRALDITWPQGEPRSSGLDTAWAAADAASVIESLDVAWGEAAIVRAACSVAWGQSAPAVRPSLSVSWQISPVVRSAVVAAWVPSTPQHRRQLDTPWPLGERRTADATLPWRPDTARHGVVLDVPWPLAALRRATVRLPWGDGDGLSWDVIPPQPLPPDPIPEGLVDPRYVGADLGCPAWAGPYSHIPVNLGVTACYNVRPRKRTYVVENEVTVIRLPDGLPIDVGNGEITRSVDSWAARVTFAPLTAEALAALTPTHDGPRAVRVTVNGYAQDFICEDWRVDRRFAQVRYSVTGRSRSALLDAPYAPTRSRIQSTISTAAQLVDTELMDTGFTCDWQTLDWTVPPGAWSYTERTPINAITDIAAGCGALVQSHATEPELIIRPRYPVSPWDWTTSASPDVTIYDDLVLQISATVENKPRYNEVFVSAEAQGVYGFFKRAGEGGGEYAEQFVHPLISTAPVHAEAGRNILSDRGGQTHWTFANFPLFPAPVLPGQIGLVEPLQLASVVEGGGTWLGRITSTRLTWARDGATLTVWQTATIARHQQDAN